MNCTKIYLSGPDCTGKTTFARWLESLGYKYIKWSVPQPGEDYAKKAMDQMAMEEKIVLDRGWLGDCIYSKILFEKEPVISKLESILLLKKWSEEGGAIFYFKTSKKTILKRMRERGDEYVKEEMLHEIIEKYDIFFDEVKSWNIPFYIIDTTHLT